MSSKGKRNLHPCEEIGKCVDLTLCYPQCHKIYSVAHCDLKHGNMKMTYLIIKRKNGITSDFMVIMNLNTFSELQH